MRYSAILGIAMAMLGSRVSLMSSGNGMPALDCAASPDYSLTHSLARGHGGRHFRHCVNSGVPVARRAARKRRNVARAKRRAR